MELVHQLMKQFGIDEAQAKGGIGAILNLAKEKLGTDFSHVSALVPGADDMMKTAPGAPGAPASSAPEAGGGLMGMIGAVGGMLGVKNVQDIAKLYENFQKLGLNTAQITGFIQTILAFVEKQGGGTVKLLLEKVLTQK